MNGRTKKIVFLALMASLALTLSYLESLLPPISASFPGIKMGLPNIVIILTLYCFGVKEAAAVSFVRLAGAVLLFGNVVTFAYSFAGAALSLSLMAILRRLDVFSAVGVSVVGGVSHNAGQIFVAILLLDTPQIGYYMCVLATSGTVAGILVGFAGSIAIKYFKRIYSGVDR